MKKKKQEKLLNAIKALLTKGNYDQAGGLFSALKPADKAIVFYDLTEAEKINLLPNLPAEDAADILEELHEDDALKMAEQLDGQVLGRILDKMQPDEAADLLGDFAEKRRMLLLNKMVNQSKVKPLLDYPDDSAGGLMTTQYYAFDETMTVGATIQVIKSIEGLHEEIPYIYVLDQNRRLTGVMRLADLFRAHPQNGLHEIMRRQVVSVGDFDDQEKAARLVDRYNLYAIPVVNDEGQLMGVITADDALAAIEVETSEDMLRSVGIMADREKEIFKSDKIINDPIPKIWLRRIPYLIITLLGGMLAGSIIGIYEEALEAVVILAFFFPVIMDMGGNAGVQSTTIFIRAHALGQITNNRFLKHLAREFAIGVSMAVLLGVIAGLIAGIWQGAEIGLTVGLALTTTVILADVLGFVIPFILIKLGADPAAGSDPFITTIKDITGLLIYFLFAFQFLTVLG